MLSSLVISRQKFVLIIDENDQEKICVKFFRQLILEQNEAESSIKLLPATKALEKPGALEQFFKACHRGAPMMWNVILPSLSEFLIYHPPAQIIRLITFLRKCPEVKRVLLWATTQNLHDEISKYTLACMEHMSDLIVRLEPDAKLWVQARSPRGGVTFKTYKCEQSADKFLVKEIQQNVEKPRPIKIEPTSTFNMQLSEDEIEARSALVMPYEKYNESDEFEPMLSDDESTPYDEDFKKSQACFF